MTDEMRAEFEVAFRAQFGFGTTDVGDSKSEDGAALMGAALWAWEASREAVVVELPIFDDYPASMERDMRESLRAAIEDQGLKVAP